MSGNVISDTGNIITPVFKFPISDLINYTSSQQGKPCGYFETHFFRCLEAYGAKLGRKFCDLEFRDYRECVTLDKQVMRSNAMRNERWKQWLQGDRKTLYEEDHLKPGMFLPYHFSNDLPS